MKKKPAFFCALIISFIMAHTASAQDYTPVIPRISGNMPMRNNATLEKYAPENLVEYPDIAREDEYENIDNQYEIQNISSNILMKQNIVESIDEVENIKINGELPKVININNAEFVNRINKRIEGSYLNIVNAGYEKIGAGFDVYNWGNITSIVIRYSVAGSAGNNTKEVVKTFVFDSISQQEVTLRNLLGKNYTEYVDMHIKADIAKADDNIYYGNDNGFTSIKPNQSFYIYEGKLMVIFDENSIAPISTGTPVFEIPFEKTISHILSPKEYAVHNDKFYIPVSTLFRLGMNINLKQGGSMDIISQNNQVIATVDVNNENMNRNDIILINGFNIGINEDFAKVHLGIDIAQDENSKELEISYSLP